MSKKLLLAVLLAVAIISSYKLGEWRAKSEVAHILKQSTEIVHRDEHNHSKAVAELTDLDTAALVDITATYAQLFVERVAVEYPDRGVAWIIAAAQRVGVDTNKLVIPGGLR